MTAVRAHAVVLDIEGTTGSAAHVRDVLFPYARRRLTGWFERHRDDPRLAELLAGVRQETGCPGLGVADAAARLAAWSDADVKAAPLKKVQGWIWAEGYADGSLHGHVYPEVPGVLRGWRADGIALHTYSSGSVGAQLDWFRHTAFGDLSVLLDGLFDLETAGPKNAPDSYRRIRHVLGVPAATCLFLSDSAPELDAAAAAGWHTVGVRRDDDPRDSAVPGHTTVADLTALSVRPAENAGPTPEKNIGKVPSA
ncbi:acireductone synthase [Streptomyces sp. NPDC057689]|uniref:acireductone synthase n=1 Tax=Streptomyces sp. NPDC057689 TaxID=3346213 RepID=UPI0036CF888A